MKLTSLKETIVDLIFPKFCLGCEKEGEWLCRNCSQKILEVETQVCPECSRISPLGRYCKRHQKRWGISGIIVATYYEEGPIKELIHNFKYNHIFELGPVLGEYLVKVLKKNDKLLAGNLLITAVPLHFWRRSQRGFNQSEILADYLSSRLELPKNFKILRKIRLTSPQVKFSGAKRRENLKNSFVFTKKINFLGRTLIIVDDVTTTGTTLNECARVLRKAGAKKVWGLVVSKG